MYGTQGIKKLVEAIEVSGSKPVRFRVTHALSTEPEECSYMVGRRRFNHVDSGWRVLFCLVAKPGERISVIFNYFGYLQSCTTLVNCYNVGILICQEQIVLLGSAIRFLHPPINQVDVLDIEINLVRM